MSYLITARPLVKKADMKEITYRINENGCHIVTSHKWRDPAGYVRINRRIEGKRINLMHRYVYITEVNQIPKGLDVCHKCDVRNCINTDHLFLGTRAENNHDRHAKGRTSRVSRSRGEKSGTAKLTEKNILYIRSMRGLKTHKVLANELGVYTNHISLIMRGLRWGHVKEGIGKRENKITKQQAIEFRQLHNSGDLDKKNIANINGITIGHLNSILSGRVHKEMAGG